MTDNSPTRNPQTTAHGRSVDVPSSVAVIFDKLNRIILLRFTESFLNREDKQLIDKLERELPGILLWAAEGWLRLQVAGRFLQPASGAADLRALDQLMSPVKAFIGDCCCVGNEHTVRVTELYREWKKWCSDNGQEAGSAQNFGKIIRAAVPQLIDERPRENDGSRYRAYRGIGICDPL